MPYCHCSRLRRWSPQKKPPNLADAKKEGKVVLYVSAQLPLAQTISRAFEKKYPFLRVEITRTSGENLLNRIKTEKLAGKMTFDVVYGATVPLMPTLGVVKPYLSAEAKAYPAKFREPKDFWAGVSANYYVIGYNAKLVAKNEVPRDWKDLLHARWKGRFAMDPEEFSWFGAMETYLGEEEGKKLMTGLARQDIQWRKNHTTLSQFLAAGEYPAALVYAHSIEDMKGKGAPIDWVRTTAPIVLDIQAVALSAQPLASERRQILHGLFAFQRSANDHLPGQKDPHQARRRAGKFGFASNGPGAVPESAEGRH